MPEILIPFPGLYESWIVRALDSEEEREIEWLADPENDSDRAETAWPEPLRLTESEIGSEFFMAMNYSAAHDVLARAYLDVFNDYIDEGIDGVLGKSKRLFKFSAMTSPKYYNFQTDRLFATVTKTFVKKLWRISKADKHETLRAVIADNFTSYDGFSSFYPNTLDDWPANVLDWDHNELNALLLAAMKIHGLDGNGVIEAFYETNAASDAIDAALDAANLDARLLPERVKKLIDWADADPEAVAKWKAADPEKWALLQAEDETEVLALDLPDLPYRCKHTPDMFAAL
jgi:hypothetical protein